MNKRKLKITLYFYLGYLAISAVVAAQLLLNGRTTGPAAAYAATLPWQLLYNLIVWPLLAWLYLKKNTTTNLPDTVFTMAFTWLFNAVAFDIVTRVVIKHPYAMSLKQFFSSQQPWLLLIYIAIFAAPFVGCWLWRRMADTTAPKKKLVIIGGGIGGLTAAVYAAKAGFDTELYEQHSIVGGECTGWDRKGYHIDNCIHWMMGTNPGTDLNRLWQTIGAVGEGIEIKRADRMYTSELDGRQLTLWHDIDRTQREMIELSPEDEPEIRRLMDFCRIGREVRIPADIPPELMSPGDLLKMSRDSGAVMKIFKAYRGMNIQDVMAGFKHPLIGCLLSDFTPADSTGNSFAMSYGNFVSGDGGIPAGASRAMAQRIRAKAESYGARIFTGKGAARILLKGERATGVQLQDGTVVNCDYVVPACDASVTFGRLLPEGYMEPLLKEMYDNRKAYPVYNTFQVALALDCAEDLFPAEMIWPCPELIFTPGMGERITIKSYGYEPSFAPEGKQILQTLQGGSEDVFEFWRELYQDREAYKATKQKLAAQTLAQIEKRFPQTKGKLTVLDAWTPMTYVRYCSAYKGFYQSFMLTKHSAKRPYPSAYIKGLDNVILAGQWISPPGGLPGAAITGKYAVQRILNLEGRSYR
ncbi:MAG: NAD(P)/FAD-dependent oxidoreductase [Syntrophomonadaceae bacterium]|nr:NAD(P)/FAD-dependent oxidoreductase [Syntrophomonadaceae bacterium]